MPDYKSKYRITLKLDKDSEPEVVHLVTYDVYKEESLHWKALERLLEEFPDTAEVESIERIESFFEHSS